MSKGLCELENCPKCNANWNNGDIYETLLQKHYSGDESLAKKAAECYGWTKTNKKFFSRLVGIDDFNYDGIIEWQCPECETNWSRFTEKEIVK